MGGKVNVKSELGKGSTFSIISTAMVKNTVCTEQEAISKEIYEFIQNPKTPMWLFLN